MEPLDNAELEEVLKSPEPPKPRTSRSKELKRDYDTWFKKCMQTLGICDNPECSDPRPGPKAMVTKLPNGKSCCRYCFLAGYGNDSSDS